MGKAARNRKLRAARERMRENSAEKRLVQDGETGPLRMNSPAGRKLTKQILGETEMPCRATFIDELFPGTSFASVSDITADGQPIFGQDEHHDRMPVMMFEPERMVAAQDPATGTMHDLRTEGLVTAGFTRVPPAVFLGAMPADGWNLHRTADGPVLLDPYGGTVAEGNLTFDPEWVSAAASARQVLVLIGPRLGIRVPPGRDPASYTPEERLKEFHECRRAGLMIAAVVGWRGLDQDKTLKWTLLCRGSLGLALPLVYVPAVALRAHGGAEAFGLTEFLPPGSPINEPSLARNMVAELTATDLDLIQPDVDRELGWICGYSPGHENQHVFRAWRQEAYECGYILVASGDKELSVTGPDCADRAMQVLLESRVAAVRVIPSTSEEPS